MDVVTLLIAVFGAITGAASLGWSIASHVLSGGRVSVELRAGWVGRAGLLSGPMQRKPIVADLSHVDTPVLAVRASNTGRLPVSVEGWGVVIGKITLGHYQHPANVAIPKLLGVGESETWIVPVSEIVAAAMAAQEVKIPSGNELRATISLGSGKARRSKVSGTLHDLPLMFPATS